MSEAIKIMDEIERDQARVVALVPNGCLIVTGPEWRSLRTAIGAQAGELAQSRARIARLISAGNAMRRSRKNAYQGWGEALNESPRQSLAAVKAEALREYAQRRRAEGEEHRAAGDTTNLYAMRKAAGIAAIEADRIESEATES